MESEQQDFDHPVNRRETSSVKWEHYASKDVIPMWVADMDFAAPPAVVAALRQRVDHGVFGYTLAPASLSEAVVRHLLEEYAWQIDPNWLVWLPGVVPGLNLATRAATSVGDAVLLATPTYPPILQAPSLAERSRVTVPFVLEKRRWELHPDHVAAAVTDRTRLFLFCNPHNPVGRSFSRTELEQLAEICLQRNLTICSDEIHCGLILDDVPHVPIASLSPEIAQRSITLMAPSKTFNIAGLNCAFAVIPDNDLRNRFVTTKAGLVPWPNALGYVACEAAFTNGTAWHRQLLAYLRDNRNLVERVVTEDLPGLSTTHVEATYLAWIDTRRSKIKDPTSFFEKAGVGLSDGRLFGAPGFVRLNFACPRKRLRLALERMKTALC